MLLLLSMIITTVWSQAMYVEEGKNAYSFAGVYETEDVEGGKSTSTGAVFFYTLNGNIDFGIAYDIVSYKDETNTSPNTDSKASGLTFGGHYNIKNPTMPFNMKFGGTYGTATLDADYLDDLQWEVEAKASSFGGGIYKSVYETETYSIIPFVNFSSIKVEVTLKDSYGDSLSEDDDFTAFGFGAGIKMKNNFYVQPTISQVDGESSFNIILGGVFQQ